MKRYICILGLLPVLLLTLLLFSCTQAQATDPASVMKALFNAVNQGKADVATNYFAKDAAIISPWGQPSGTKGIHDWFAVGIIPMKTQLKIGEFSVDGVNLAGTFKITDVGFHDEPFKVMAVIQDGKIKSMTWTGAK